MLPHEEEKHDDLAALFRQSPDATEPTDQFLQELHQRLQGELADSLRPPVRQTPGSGRLPGTARFPYGVADWIGGFTVKQWIALSGVSVAALLGLFLFWGGIGVDSASAMEKMAQRIREAKSYKGTVIERSSYRAKQGDSEKTAQRTTQRSGTIYWLAPNSLRMEGTESSSGQGPGTERTTVIRGSNGPSIRIDHSAKTFSRIYPPTFGPLERLEKFAEFSGDADRELGTKKIKGREALGFVIDSQKIDPAHLSIMLEIWIDTETKLPVLIRSDTRTETMTTTGEMSNIQWNIDLDPSLFDPTPPQGYTDVTPKLPSSEKVGQIIQTLRIYAKASGGHYPRDKPMQSRMVDKLIVMFTPDGKAQSEDPPEADVYSAAKRVVDRLEQLPRKKREEVHLVAKGFQLMSNLQFHNPDFAYHGKTVMPSDKNKVLIRWKLDDGRYLVIFGDLQSETVTAQRLRALEEK